MPVRDVVIFPHMMTPFVVGRESSVRALEEALAGEKKIFLATQHDASIDEPRPEEIYSVGTIVNIVQSLKLPDGNIKVLVEGVERGKIVSVTDEEGFFRAVVRTFHFKVEPGPATGGAGLARQHAVRTVHQAQPEPELRDDDRGDPGGRSRKAGRYRRRQPAAHH